MTDKPTPEELSFLETLLGMNDGVYGRHLTEEGSAKLTSFIIANGRLLLARCREADRLEAQMEEVRRILPLWATCQHLIVRMLQEQNKRLIDLLDTNYQKRRAEQIQAPEDPEVLALCQRWGFGAVMDSACRQWYLIDPVGAHTKGHCFGTIDAVLGGKEGEG